MSAIGPYASSTLAPRELPRRRVRQYASARPAHVSGLAGGRLRMTPIDKRRSVSADARLPQSPSGESDSEFARWDRAIVPGAHRTPPRRPRSNYLLPCLGVALAIGTSVISAATVWQTWRTGPDRGNIGSMTSAAKAIWSLCLVLAAAPVLVAMGGLIGFDDMLNGHVDPWSGPVQPRPGRPRRIVQHHGRTRAPEAPTVFKSSDASRCDASS